jgi:hypothetical protein
MRALELLVCTLSVGCAFAYLCRLDALQYKRHTLKTIVLHISLLVSTLASALASWEGDLSIQTLAGVAAAAMWIWVSLPSWRFGPPSHVTKAQPIEPKHWPHIVGRGKD